MVYRITSAKEWSAAVASGTFDGSADDARDGFIHLSTAAQVRETAARHYAGKRDLVLVQVDAALLGGRLRWERSRGEALFPHLYGTLPTSAARRVDPLPLDDHGTHVFPQAVLEGVDQAL